MLIDHHPKGLHVSPRFLNAADDTAILASDPDRCNLNGIRPLHPRSVGRNRFIAPLRIAGPAACHLAERKQADYIDRNVDGDGVPRYPPQG
jgi:hypothetical protein